MFTLKAAIASLILFLVVVYILFPRTFKSQLDHIFKYLLGCHNLPIIRYHKDSAFCESLLQNCPILKKRYTPPLWGYIGHLQTIWFGGRDSIFPPDKYKGKRQYVYVDDGSTVTYDIFEPSSKTRDEVILVVPGIGNSSETDYIQAFCKQANDIGYCVCVLNHMGSLKDHKLTGHRIFTYGGTGDLTVMFNDLESKFDADTKFIGVGLSMGGLILVRFLGEQINLQRRFLCAISVCQGYCSNEATKIAYSPWQEMVSFYFFLMTKRLVSLMKRHKDQLYTNHPVIKRKLSPRSNGVVTNGCISTSVKEGKESVTVPYLSGDRDLNGFPIDNERILVPDDKMWSAKSFAEIDEYYTRRVMGFDSYKDLVKWVTCNEHFYKIPDLPILFLNAYDDPIIPKQLSALPIKYTEFNHNAMFVGTEHGGHLGYFEGGWIVPNEIRWCDRLIFQYIHGCNNTSSPSSS